MANPCQKCARLPRLAFHIPRVHRRAASFCLEAHDIGDAVTLSAAESYNRYELPGDPATLDLEHARRLRDWLTVWLERQIGPL